MTNSNRTNAAIEKPYKLLIADDQPQILEALRLLLKPEGYQMEMVRTPALLLDALMHDSFDGVLIDLNYTRDTTSGQEGMELVARIKEMDPQLPVDCDDRLQGNIDLAVEVRCAAERAVTSSRNRGKIRACSAFCARRNCILQPAPHSVA